MMSDEEQKEVRDTHKITLLSNYAYGVERTIRVRDTHKITLLSNN